MRNTSNTQSFGDWLDRPLCTSAPARRRRGVGGVSSGPQDEEPGEPGAPGTGDWIRDATPSRSTRAAICQGGHGRYGEERQAKILPFFAPALSALERRLWAVRVPWHADGGRGDWAVSNYVLRM